MNGCTELVMPQDTGIGIISFQLPQQIEQRTFLRKSTCIGRTPFFIEPTFITYTDTLVVPTGGMRPNLMDRTADVNLAVTSDIEVITNTRKSPCQMAATKCFDRKMAVATCSATMNYQEVHLPIVLIKTSCSHVLNPCRN